MSGFPVYPDADVKDIGRIPDSGDIDVEFPRTPFECAEDWEDYQQDLPPYAISEAYVFGGVVYQWFFWQFTFLEYCWGDRIYNAEEDGVIIPDIRFSADYQLPIGWNSVGVFDPGYSESDDELWDFLHSAILGERVEFFDPLYASPLTTWISYNHSLVDKHYYGVQRFNREIGFAQLAAYPYDFAPAAFIPALVIFALDKLLFDEGC